LAWIGKVIGGTVGLVLGGPLGMIAGAAFGHMIDRSSELPQNQNTAQQDPRFFYSQPGSGAAARDNRQYQAQLVFFVGIFSMLAKLAKADGSVSEQERRKVQEFIDRELRLTGESKEAAERIFETALREGGTFEEFATQYYQQFRRDQDMLELAVDILFRVAAADGRITYAEEKLIDEAVRIFRIPKSTVDAIRRRYTDAAAGETKKKKRPYAVLGVTPSSSNEEIKRAYRQRVSEYHPDKIASKGLPDEFIKFANDKFREIQEAYESIRKERGF